MSIMYNLSCLFQGPAYITHMFFHSIHPSSRWSPSASFPLPSHITFLLSFQQVQTLSVHILLHSYSYSSPNSLNTNPTSPSENTLHIHSFPSHSISYFLSPLDPMSQLHITQLAKLFLHTSFFIHLHVEIPSFITYS